MIRSSGGAGPDVGARRACPAFATSCQCVSKAHPQPELRSILRAQVQGLTAQAQPAHLPPLRSLKSFADGRLLRPVSLGEAIDVWAWLASRLASEAQPVRPWLCFGDGQAGVGPFSAWRPRHGACRPGWAAGAPLALPTLHPSVREAHRAASERRPLNGCGSSLCSGQSMPFGNAQQPSGFSGQNAAPRSERPRKQAPPKPLVEAPATAGDLWNSGPPLASFQLWHPPRVRATMPSSQSCRAPRIRPAAAMSDRPCAQVPHSNTAWARSKPSP